LESLQNSLGAELQICGETLLLFPQKFAYWHKERTIFIADTHFGKVAHFRKSGIGLPSNAGLETFAQLHYILIEWKPDRIIILGDIFHSDFNQDFERFKTWRAQFETVEFVLVLGNHDETGFSHFSNLGLTVHNSLILGPFFCTHVPDFQSSRGFNLCGHIHPAVSLSVGRQHINVPCFWKGDNHLCFPSFGAFTGSVPIKACLNDLIYAISGTRIRLLEGSVV
jgi:DNA ligase-associated metallophosphoesterase